MKSFRFHILMGLPGSGKTHFVNNEYHEHQSNSNEYYATKNIHKGMFDVYDYFIDLDNKYFSGISLENALHFEFADNEITKTKQFYSRSPKVVNVVIDGLILTNEVLQTAIRACFSYLDEHYKNHEYNIEFIIHKWNENREACLLNDRYRVKFGQRKESTETTIRNAKFEDVDLNWLDNMIAEIDNVQYYVYNHVVTAADPFIIGFKPFCDKENIMTSDSWSGGGTSGNCWDNELHTIYPENTPEFKRFDEMIEKICPDITFIQYKKLYNACVTVESYTESDYYGGREIRNYYECDMEKLYEMIQEMDLIKV